MTSASSVIHYIFFVSMCSWVLDWDTDKDSAFSLFHLDGTRTLNSCSVRILSCRTKSLTVWLNCLANCQATYKENYGPWGVWEKLHHWQFYLGELQGLDNAPLKYDDRLEGIYLVFFKINFTKPSQLKATFSDIPRWSCRRRVNIKYHKFSLTAVTKTEKNRVLNVFRY